MSHAHVGEMAAHSRVPACTLSSAQEATTRALAGTKRLRSVAADCGVSHETIRAVLRQRPAVGIVSHPRQSLLAHSEHARSHSLVPGARYAQAVQEVTAPLHEHGKATLQHLRHATPIVLGAGR